MYVSLLSRFASLYASVNLANEWVSVQWQVRSALALFLQRMSSVLLAFITLHPKFWQSSQAHCETLGNGAVQSQELDSVPVGSPAHSLICPHRTFCTTTATGLVKHTGYSVTPAWGPPILYSKNLKQKFQGTLEIAQPLGMDLCFLYVHCSN